MLTSLSTRVVAGVAVIALAAVLAVALAARHGSRAAFVQFRDRQQEHTQRLSDTHDRIKLALDGRCCTAESLAAAAAVTPPGAGVLVVASESNRVIGYAGHSFAGATQVNADRRHGVLTVSVERPVGGRTGRVTVGVAHGGTVVRLADGRHAQAFAVWLPSAEEVGRINAFYVTLDRRLLVITGFAGLAIVLLAWAVARRIVRPLKAVSRAARGLARGERGLRVPEDGSDEVAELARSFNAMAADLERQEGLRRNLFNDVAHELRTPLTALRCRLESVIDGLAPDPGRAVRDLHDEVLHLGRLVDDLQELSAAEARDLRLDVGPVALSPVLQSAARAAGLLEDERLRVNIDDGVSVQADAGRLRQILLNLLTNASRYTPASGVIEVAARPHDSAVTISVRNTGSSLDAEQRERVFDRFYRTDPARQRATGGAGLGLAIVKSLALAMRGRVEVASGPDDVTFTIVLPGAARP